MPGFAEDRRSFLRQVAATSAVLLSRRGLGLAEVASDEVAVDPPVTLAQAERLAAAGLLADRPDTLVAAWDRLGALWDETVDRARKLPDEQVTQRVGGEWSFVETLRHLLFVTDSWVRRGILRVEDPWDPWDLPWDEMPDTPGIPRDRTVRPDLDDVLVRRRERQALVRGFLAQLTDARLDEHTEPLDGDSWPPARPFAVRECLEVLLLEEWHHRLYAERDLTALGAPT